ncbi:MULTISPECIES: DUF4259 domain-containing protein [Pseudomonas]|uniref:DUF4259 domain-containing protein n=1 Tax=Pseudomonas kribbensis TaxID=1628086 RepID=A0A4Y8VG33_9PSED|nr:MULTISPECIES: DUF4259 domain-containing protein [Pseudomonas]TFH79852.1 DUF4259 domain-containing protein [Pseudomonas kribbensis]
MGTWSIHAFGNDEAADFAIELSESSNLDLIQSALEDVIVAAEYLEAPEADRGIAAAAVLALLNGQEIPGTLDEALSTWVKSQTTKPGSALLTKAQVVIERVLSENSELAELWIESDEYESWQDGLRLIKASLGR